MGHEMVLFLREDGSGMLPGEFLCECILVTNVAHVDVTPSPLCDAVDLSRLRRVSANCFPACSQLVTQEAQERREGGPVDGRLQRFVVAAVVEMHRSCFCSGLYFVLLISVCIRFIFLLVQPKGRIRAPTKRA